MSLGVHNVLLLLITTSALSTVVFNTDFNGLSVGSVNTTYGVAEPQDSDTIFRALKDDNEEENLLVSLMSILGEQHISSKTKLGIGVGVDSEQLINVSKCLSELGEGFRSEKSVSENVQSGPEKASSKSYHRSIADQGMNEEHCIITTQDAQTISRPHMGHRVGPTTAATVAMTTRSPANLNEGTRTAIILSSVSV